MSQQNQDNQSKRGWKTRTYLFGGLLGAFMGFASAYLFAKEAEAEGDADEEKAPDIPAGAMRTELKRVGAVREDDHQTLHVERRYVLPATDHQKLITMLIHAAYPVLANINHKSQTLNLLTSKSAY